MKKSSAAKSFSDVLALHRELEEMFYEHQRALLDFNFRAALERLRAYEAALVAHMRDEVELLLPLNAEPAEIERGGAKEFFLLEHEKMRRHVAHFRAELPKLVGMAEPSRALIKLLDQETTYKHIVEHHGEREEKFLYPALELVTTEAERDELLPRLFGHGRRARAGRE
jgi:hypothetical protein